MDELVEALNADPTLSPELRRDAIKLARERGNSYPFLLAVQAGRTGRVANKTRREYDQALRRAAVAVQVMPWYHGAHLTLGLLQFRTGDYGGALASAQRGMELQKSRAADGIFGN